MNARSQQDKQRLHHFQQKRLAKIGEQDASGRHWHRAIAFNAGKTCGSVTSRCTRRTSRCIIIPSTCVGKHQTGPKAFISLSSTFHVWKPSLTLGPKRPKVEALYLCAERKNAPDRVCCRVKLLQYVVLYSTCLGNSVCCRSL